MLLGGSSKEKVILKVWVLFKFLTVSMSYRICNASVTGLSLSPSLQTIRLPYCGGWGNRSRWVHSENSETKPRQTGSCNRKCHIQFLLEQLIGYVLYKTDGVNWCSALPKNTVYTEHPQPNLDLQRKQALKYILGTVLFAFYSAKILLKLQNGTWICSYISLSYYISEFLSFFQSARVMEGEYICVDNSGLLQKVQMNRRKTCSTWWINKTSVMLLML